MEKKFTDEEIVKAIDKCYAIPVNCEDGCPYFNKYGRNFCVEDKRFYHDLKDLLKRQKVEIERLKNFIDFKAANVMCDKCKEKTVKDTAKEIANWLPTTVNEDKNVLSMIIKEHYGVEVE